jgi:predicted nucleic acid-binding protein
MTAERALSFVDTNVLVYGFSSSSPKKPVAQRLVNELIEEDLLWVSTQVLQELFVTLTRKVSQPCSSEEALAILEDLSAWPLRVVDYAAIRGAAGLALQATLSFRDALAVVAAVRTSATVLYTDALNDGQEILGVRVSTYSQRYRLSNTLKWLAPSCGNPPCRSGGAAAVVCPGSGHAAAGTHFNAPEMALFYPAATIFAQH